MGMNFKKAAIKSNMDMYIEKNLQKNIVNNTPGVCYVCGSPNSATHLLKIKSNSSSEPHFPFLEHHEPPTGCELPKSNGVVVVCYVCYRFLLAQWDSHEKNNTPYSTRLYWLKRVDHGPYSGSETQPQEERHIEASPPSGAPLSQAQFNPLKRQRSPTLTKPDDPVLPKMERISPRPEDSALDLRSSASVNRERDNERAPSRSSVLSHDSGLSGQQEVGGAGGCGGGVVEILDLSMPDKNATTEVCYVCGDEFQKGILLHVYAKPIQHSPFFPSLMLHPRPSRSRPMDSAGRVQACEVCSSYLLQQWSQHQSRSTPHAERHYLLRKRHTPVYDTTTFICYACGLEYPSSSLRLLYCRPNAENEPYFPYLENIKPPSGSSPISPQGMAQVCAICYKSIPQRYKVFGTGDSARMNQMASPPIPTIQERRPSPVIAYSELNPELSCYVCHRLCITDSMKLLSCYPERRHSFAGMPSPPRVMHFPFLKTLPTPPGSSYFDNVNRTLVCMDCFGHFSHQWHVFESDGLALELRHYTLPAAVHRMPPLTLTVPRLQEIRSSPNSPSRESCLPKEGLSANVQPQPVSPGQRRRPARPATPEKRPQSSLSNRTPPAGSGSTTALPSPGSTPVAPPNEQQHKDNPAESSIYCFLCGLNSTRAFAHWLPSAVSVADPSAPYFPFITSYAASSRAEGLREDGAALVCTFCYHMVHSQWKQYEDAPANKTLQPNTRVYNTHDYACYVCGIATYRKRVRALPVKDFPFLKQHRQPRHSLSIEKGQFVVVCLDCFESLRTQSLEYERWGLPVEKRQYNWMAIPPPPEDSNNLSTPLERLLAMEQQKRNKEQRAKEGKAEPSSADAAKPTADSTTQCSSGSTPDKP